MVVVIKKPYAWVLLIFFKRNCELKIEALEESKSEIEKSKKVKVIYLLCKHNTSQENGIGLKEDILALQS